MEVIITLILITLFILTLPSAVPFIMRQLDLRVARKVQGKVMLIDKIDERSTGLTKDKVWTPYAGKVQIPGLDEFKKQLPIDRLAKDGEVATTIIRLRWSHRLVGDYQRGGRGFRVCCTVEVINARRKMVLSERTFVGSAPPESVIINHRLENHDRSGDLPTVKVTNYLRVLLAPNLPPS